MSQNKLPPLGAHFSVSKGFKAAFEEASSTGASALQIFTKAPMAARMREVTEEEAAEVAASPIRSEIRSAVVHASYLLNFAKPQSADAYEQRSVAEDLRSIEKLGGEGVVLHMGKYLGVAPATAEAIFAENLEKVLKQTDGLKAAIILENTAGQGTEMGYRMEDYGRILQLFKKNKRIRCCIDTAHIFGAGYDLSTASGVKETIAALEEHVGLDRIACVHFNDSKKPLASRVDRHEDIGHGMIKEEGLKLFLTTLNKKVPTLPFILETPQGFATYKEQLDIIKSWF